MEFQEVVILPEVEQKLINKHNVWAFEVEEIFQQHPHIRFVQKGKIRGENLYVAMGQTETRRYLNVFFINKGEGAALVISARDMDSKERKLYAKIRKK